MYSGLLLCFKFTEFLGSHAQCDVGMVHGKKNGVPYLGISPALLYLQPGPFDEGHQLLMRDISVLATPVLGQRPHKGER